MNPRRIVSTALVLGAILVSAAAVAALSPLGDADATSPANRVPAEEIASLVDDMAPGAVVAEQTDGSVSITGALNAQEQAEIRHARAVADASPWVIQCKSAGLRYNCVAVKDSDVAAAVKAGESGLYNRVMYRSISTEVTDSGAPMFDRDELVCAGSGTALSCTRVDDVQPVIAHDETVFMTYRPLQMTFDERGGQVLHVSRSPEVPLKRATP